MRPDPLIATDIAAYLRQHETKALLRFLTCGSVDDGKSTLIGRLLHDTHMIYEDQLNAVRKDSAKVGTTGDAPDLALLVDGLKAEREQGITIDVAYRYFSTAKRKFIIADCPGHEQYTRNMATGASTCDLAVILIDARKGVLPQTRRHSYIVSLLGIKHVVVVVNKMDVAGYSRATYDAIVAQFTAFAAKLRLPSVHFLPCSALTGDNVAARTQAMPWYDGPSLMELLEAVDIGDDAVSAPLRFPVQLVQRPHQDYRGFAGTVASGVVHAGDAVTVLPSRVVTRVKSIVTHGGEREHARAGEAVALVLQDEVDLSRGDMLVHGDQQPRASRHLEAMLVWLAEQPLDLGREYLLKHTTRTTRARVETIFNGIDIETIEPRPADALGLNQIGRVAVSAAQPLYWDPYDDNRVTGAFVLIDRFSNATVGAGMIIGEAAAKTTRGDRVAASERLARQGHTGCAVLLSGEPSAVTRLADLIERALFERQANVIALRSGVPPSVLGELVAAGFIVIAPAEGHASTFASVAVAIRAETEASQMAESTLQQVCRQVGL